jgi:tetratricopeptide (TPR) repeat protein
MAEPAPDEFARLRALVAEAVALPAPERAPFLARALPDPALRREAEELLALGLQQDGFLAPSQGAALAAALGRAAPQAGTELGGFRLVRVLGEGGMGTVFEAEQRAPRRRVALKVVRAGLAGPEARARFARESEVLARLRHPGIAAVYASGVEGEGPAAIPWYALELVEGARTLTAHARELGLGVRARVALLGEVADAVHHGHLKGVVHRDLKPANVLVDAAGRVRVIDFGIARALGDEAGTLATRRGEVLGSLECMSPEQLGGRPEEVDARSDVWALGVLLYELVCGRPPFPAAGLSLAHAARVIQEEPPPRPRALVPALARDLERILLHALEKDPARRYASAAALREDLLAWLDGRAIAARPPSLAYQLRVLARRHRTAAAALVVVVLAALVAAGVSLGAARRARVAEGRSARRFDETRGLARSILFELHDSIARLAGATAARRTLVATALAYLDALEAEAGDEPGLLLELCEGRLRLAEILGAPGLASLGDVAGGVREARRARELAERLAALAPEDRAAQALGVRTRVVLGNLELEAGASAAALAQLASAVNEADALAAQADAKLETRRLPALARTLQANALAATGRGAEALAALARATELTRALAHAAPEWDELARDLVIQLEKTGRLQRTAGEIDAALATLGEGLARAEARLAQRPEDAQTRQDVAHLSEALGLAHAARDAARGRVELERGVELGRAQVARDPDDWNARESLSIALEGLGSQRLAAGDAAAALALHEEARELSRALLARTPESPRERGAVAVGDTFVGQSLAALGRPAEARAAFERALATLDELLAANPTALEPARHRAGALGELTALELEHGDPRAALALCEELTRTAESLAGRDPSQAASQRLPMVAAARLGLAHKALGEREDLPTRARAAHLAIALEAFERCLREHDRLAPLGLLMPSDGEARTRVEADQLTCHALAASLEQP